MSPKNEWLIKVSLSVIGLGMLLDAGRRNRWI